MSDNIVYYGCHVCGGFVTPVRTELSADKLVVVESAECQAVTTITVIIYQP